ncbi:MAG: hypothetical protein GC158_02360 [Cyanobacteria bacterium RI_101]|nr:hypothetical protein [Cyanobacteria bacterium RI_101]
MLGRFQRSCLRLEVPAPGAAVGQALTRASQLRQWLAPQYFGLGLPERLTQGLTFTTGLGLLTIEHRVDYLSDNALRLLLSRGVDGFQEWSWGDGWAQSRLEGISLLPLNLAQTACLWRLRQFLESER